MEGVLSWDRAGSSSAWKWSAGGRDPRAEQGGVDAGPGTKRVRGESGWQRVLVSDNSELSEAEVTDRAS